MRTFLFCWDLYFRYSSLGTRTVRLMRALEIDLTHAMLRQIASSGVPLHVSDVLIPE